MKSLVVFLSILTLFPVIQLVAQDSNYVELSEEQLKKIGFVIDERGIFFKVALPHDGYQKGRVFFSCISFYNGTDINGTMIGSGDPFSEQTIFEDDKEADVLNKKLKPIEVDYYLIRVLDLTGKQNFSFHRSDIEVLPILVKQSQYNFYDKRDIILYLKYTESLKEKLNDVDDLDSYVITYKKEDKEE